MLELRKQCFDQLGDQYNAEQIQTEPVVVNFCYSLMYMIATGQTFEPYFYHLDADVEQRRADSEYCLEKLKSGNVRLTKGNPPSKCNVDWKGEWLSSEFQQRWRKDYVIPDVEPIPSPQRHPCKYVAQQDAVRLILPAKGILPVGSYIGSPGFGLIHPNTISAAVLQNAGVKKMPAGEKQSIL